MIKDFWTEFRLFWCGAFLLAAERACPRNFFAVKTAIRQALNAMPAD